MPVGVVRERPMARMLRGAGLPLPPEASIRAAARIEKAGQDLLRPLRTISARLSRPSSYLSPIEPFFRSDIADRRSGSPVDQIAGSCPGWECRRSGEYAREKGALP